MILGIYCAGHLGKELYDIALRINERENKWEKIIFIDDVFEDKLFYGAEVYRLSDMQNQSELLEVVIANGTPINRKALREKIESLNFSPVNLIDPTAIISPTAILGKGIIITPYSTISSHAVLKDNVLIHSYVRIGHDIEVGEDSVISSNVGIGGKTVVGTRTYVGLGAAIRDNLSIGSDVIISLGAVVHTDVPDGVTMVAHPARVSRINETGKVFK